MHFIIYKLYVGHFLSVLGSHLPLLSFYLSSPLPGVPHGLPRSATPAGGGLEVPAEVHGIEPAGVLQYHTPYD